jgi:hypothetical protein
VADRSSCPVLSEARDLVRWRCVECRLARGHQPRAARCCQRSDCSSAASLPRRECRSVRERRLAERYQDARRAWGASAAHLPPKSLVSGAFFHRFVEGHRVSRKRAFRGWRQGGLQQREKSKPYSARAGNVNGPRASSNLECLQCTAGRPVVSRTEVRRADVPPRPCREFRIGFPRSPSCRPAAYL